MNRTNRANRKRQLDGRVGPKRLSGKPKLPSCEHGSWYVVPQAVAAIEQRSKFYLQGVDIADDAEVSPMAVAVGQKGIADNHLRHRPSHSGLIDTMLAEVATVSIVCRVSPLATKCALNVNSRNIFLAAVKKVVAQTHRAIEHALNRVRNKLPLGKQATMQSRCNCLVKGPFGRPSRTL